MTVHQKRRAVTRARNESKAERALPDQTPGTEKATKIGRILELLARPEGASLAELTAATGWQAHSVRGALAGTLKKKGHVVGSEKIDGARRYRIGAAR